MKFDWYDYNPVTMEYVENWLDEHAVRMTGIEDGFRDNYEYWANESYNIVGKNYWCKVVSENGMPFAVIQFGLHEEIFTIMEIFIDPEKRNQGKGTELLKELLLNGKQIIGVEIQRAEAVIFPSNKASQKTFEKAGFRHLHTHEDGDAVDYIFEA